MALPTITVPEFDLEVPGIKKSMKFRPFLVRESKILTLALEGGEVEDQVKAIQQVVDNCSFGKLNAKKLPLYQLQWIFLKLKAKSVGNTQDFILTCGNCENKINYTMDINDFEIIGNTDISNKKIEINESTGIVFKYPPANVQASSNNVEDDILIMNCIEYIYDEEEIIKAEDISPEELTEWLDTLPLEITQKIGSFFEEMPLMGHIVEYKCNECEKENKVAINGYEHFFV